MTLQEGTVGKRYVVEGLSLPVSLERRLEALGLLEGSKIDLLRKRRRGAMVITVRGTRFAVGPGISAHIFVTEARRG